MYPTDAAICLVGLSCSVVERHKFPSVTSLPPVLEQWGLPPLVSSAGRFEFAGHLAWESTFTDSSPSSLLETRSVRVRPPVSPRSPADVAEPEGSLQVEWRKVISDNAERVADDPIVPVLVSLNERISSVGGQGNDATD